MEDRIKTLMKHHNSHLVGALLKIHSLQTHDEQLMKTTGIENGVGFNKFDASFCSSVAEQAIKNDNTLSLAQIDAIRPIMMKYANQLSRCGYAPVRVKIKTKEETPLVQPSKVCQVLKKSNRILIKFPHDWKTFLKVSRMQLSKRVSDRNSKIHMYTTPLSDYYIKQLKDLGFNTTAAEKHIHNLRLSVNPYYKKFDKISGLKKELAPFQMEDVNKIDQFNGNCILAHNMGEGKTIMALAYLQLHRNLKPAIIVVPAHMKYKWKHECEETLSRHRLFVIEGKPKLDMDMWWQFLLFFPEMIIFYKLLYGKRLIAEHETTSGDNAKGIAVIIINYDIVWHWLPMLLETNPKACIFDESQYLKTKVVKEVKGKKSKNRLRGKACYALSLAADHVLELTGTPFKNRHDELYQQVKNVNPWIFPSWFEFAIKFCRNSDSRSRNQFKGSSNHDELNKILYKYCLIRRQGEVLDLPNKSRNFLHFDISNKMEYRVAEEDFLEWMRDTFGDERAARAAKAQVLVQMGILRQLSALGKIRDIIKYSHDLLENYDRIGLVFYHKSVMKALKDSFEKKGKRVAVIAGGVSNKKKFEIEQATQRGEVDVLLLNVKSATGLTLTKIKNFGMVEMDWTPADNIQAEERIHRWGQDEKTYIHYFVGENTIDEDLLKMLNVKQTDFDRTIDGKQTKQGFGGVTDKVSYIEDATDILINKYFQKAKENL